MYIRRLFLFAANEYWCLSEYITKNDEIKVETHTHAFLSSTKGGTMRKVFEKFLLGNMATPQNYAICLEKLIFEEEKNFRITPRVAIMGTNFDPPPKYGQKIFLGI